MYSYLGSQILGFRIKMVKEIIQAKNVSFTVCPRSFRTLIVLWESGNSWDTLY